MSDNEEQQIKLDLSALHFWAINERNDIGIPAVEQDTSTGNYNVLIWTSKESALKYCWVKKPDAAHLIYPLHRRTRRLADGTSEVIQAGLIKIARHIMTGKHREITHFVIDNPGTATGRALYLLVEDMAYLGRKPLPQNVRSARDLKNFLDTIDDDV